MAVADRSVSSPPAGAATPLVLRSRLALAAADAVMCVCFASAWLLSAAADAFFIGHAIWAEDSPVLEAAMPVVRAVAFSFTICCFSILAALSTCIADPNTKEDEAPASPRSSAAAKPSALDYSLALGLIATYEFFLLGAVGNLLKGPLPVKGSRSERIACAIMDVGYSSGFFFLCLVVIPAQALRTWRLRRSGWRWCECATRVRKSLQEWNDLRRWARNLMY